jgi:hypothetical protein
LFEFLVTLGLFHTWGNTAEDSHKQRHTSHKGHTANSAVNGVDLNWSRFKPGTINTIHPNHNQWGWEKEGGHPCCPKEQFISTIIYD